MVDGLAELEGLLPGFDPLRLGRVESLHLDLDEQGLVTVRVQAPYGLSTEREVLLELTFFGAREVTVPTLGSLDISELEVRDVSDRQLEGIHREVVNHGGERFALLCRNAKVTRALSRDGELLLTNLE